MTKSYHQLKEDFLNLFPGIALGIFMIVMIIRYNLGQNELKKNGIVLNGKILDVKSGNKFEYEFMFDGKKYTDNCSAGVFNPGIFVGKTFPLIFSPKSKRSWILVKSKYFKKFGIEFPDSLNWVRPFEIKPFDWRTGN